MTTTYTCEQCEVMTIQGMRCHETGCPDAWQDETRICSWCGADFQPDNRWEAFDDESCYNSYHDIEAPDSEFIQSN